MQEPYKIGVLFESDEWSDHKLAYEIEESIKRISETEGSSCPVSVVMIDMQESDSVNAALTCDLLVSRVFASARFRDHESALANMDVLVNAFFHTDIVMINPPEAHRYETSKELATRKLAEEGLDAPRIFGRGFLADLKIRSFEFPCLIKPNCGGRTTATAVLRNESDLERFEKDAPDVEYLVEEYITPEFGYVTRAEIVDGDVALVVKRGIVDGLSAYHLGSTYEVFEDYPEDLKADFVKAARALGFAFGSFDVIENGRGRFFIDANSVSNVSEDCTDLFDLDLMHEYGQAIARMAMKDRGRKR